MIIIHTIGMIPHYKTGKLVPCYNVEVREDNGALADPNTICYVAAVDPPNYPTPSLIRFDLEKAYWVFN